MDYEARIEAANAEGYEAAFDESGAWNPFDENLQHNFWRAWNVGYERGYWAHFPEYV